MEEAGAPLISEASSSRNSGGSNPLQRAPKAYQTRSNAIAYGTRFQKAAALVDLAEDGIGLPEEVLNDERFERSAKFYFMYIRFDWLWSLNLFALIVLNFLEKPVWCAKSGQHSCQDRDFFFLGQLPYLTSAESLIYEMIFAISSLALSSIVSVSIYPQAATHMVVFMLHPMFIQLFLGILLAFAFNVLTGDNKHILPTMHALQGNAFSYNYSQLQLPGVTLLILVLHTLFPLAYEGGNLYWKNHLNKLKILIVLLLMCDMLVYALYISPVVMAYLPFRFAPYIRVAFVALTIRELRQCIVTLAGMVGMYLNVLALWLLFLLFASWLAYVTFEDTQQGKVMFYSYGATLYQMFVLFTTSNNPDVWIPAYKSSRWSCLFFVVYVLLGVYFLTNLILAVVYDSFKTQLAEQVGEMDAMRIRILGKAFSLIDTYKQGFLNKEQCIRLFEELNKYRSLPKTSREDFELIFDELDHSGDFKINLEEFMDLCNAIALRFQKEPTPSYFERFPTFYHSTWCKKVKAFVRSPTFGYIVVSVLVLNLVAVIIETTLDIENSSGQGVWQVVEFCFGWIYVVEIALKIFSLGFDAYWMEGQNRFDFVVTWIIVIGEATTFFFSSELPFLSNGEWIRYLLIARMLRLIRLLLHVQRYRAFVATFLTLLPSLMPYLGIIFCVLCIYCSLGLQLFGGIVNSGNSELETTELFDNDYVLFNFNDYPNGMVTLFNLLVMGNWQVWMTSYKDLTGTSWTLAYFISFYLITVLLLLNLVVAFVLEAFFAEIEMEIPSGSEEDKDSPGRKDRRRHVGVKTRSRTVDILLHRVLSAELSAAKE